MISTYKLTLILLFLIQVYRIQAEFSNVPPPPARPDRFTSREELKKYLQKVHEYHSIVGRWRLRRSFLKKQHPPIPSSDDDLFRFFDINNDHAISKSEFTQHLKSNQ